MREHPAGSKIFLASKRADPARICWAVTTKLGSEAKPLELASGGSCVRRFWWGHPSRLDRALQGVNGFLTVPHVMQFAAGVWA